MATQFSVTWLDHSREKATSQFRGVTMDAANFAAQVVLQNAIVSAAQDLSGGAVNRRTTSVIRLYGATLPTDQEAARESKWLIGYTDVQAELAAGVTNPLFGKKYTTSLPTALKTGHLVTNSDYADLTETEVAAFVTAFEAFARSPAGGTIEVNYVKFVGRNS